MQDNLLKECSADRTNFWKSFGKIGVGQSKRNKVPLEVILDNGEVSSNLNDVLLKWKRDFSSLFDTNYMPSNGDSCTDNPADSDWPAFNENISIFEIKKALDNANKGKAAGFDGIPTEVLVNDATVLFLHSLFNVCFETGKVPLIWGKTIINPIPKSSSADPRDPLSYRGISLASALYKIYSSILNSRLNTWAERNNKIVEEQNGFRKSRSTTDQILSLINIIETRKKQKKSTFCAFIDFRKAYDMINREKLWQKLIEAGVGGKMFYAIKSLYTSVTASVRLGAYSTEWFDIKCGLRQGCILSPILFNLYVNDLALYLKSFNIGIQLGDEKVCMFLFADDIVLLAENNNDLQFLLDGLNGWCCLNSMSVNETKSNIVHFRPNSFARSDYAFTCGNSILNTVDRYKYLGVILHEHLDFTITAKSVAQSANRALGLLVARCKLIGGVPFNVFSKLYNSIVWPVISYSAPIWGTKEYTCINAVQTRAMRFFLGVGKYTPNTALYGEMAWEPPIVKQWGCLANYWCRLFSLHSDRLNKRIALWANQKASSSCRNWFYSVKSKFSDMGLQELTNNEENINKFNFVKCVKQCTMADFKEGWITSINRIDGINGRGRNKLRTYRLFKQNYDTEQYCRIIMPPSHRSAFCKFRCGVAPIRIETGRYENLVEEERKCPFCKTVKEDESHVILSCPEYSDLRTPLMLKASEVCDEFFTLSKVDQMKVVFTHPSLIRICAKTCFNILKQRSQLLCK